MCDYCKHNLSTQTQERIYWIHDTFICCGIKLCTKLHNTEPDICDLWHAKSIYFQSTDTLRIQWPFPLHKVGVAFLIYESNQDRPCDFVMSCWQSLCSPSSIGLSMVVFQRQYKVLVILGQWLRRKCPLRYFYFQLWWPFCSAEQKG